MILNKNKYISFNLETHKFKNVYQKINNWKIWLWMKLLDIENNNINKNNIYEILNDFENDRKESSLIWFNYIWIDLDYFEWTLEDILKMSFESLNIYPTKINKTYKGYHLFYKLSDNLYNLNIKQYKKLYELINISIWWDEKMRSVTWILKVENYIDYKNDRNYLIKNIYLNNNNILNENNCINIIWEKLIYENRKLKLENKIKRKNRNVDLINKIDAIDFINWLNESWLFSEIKVENWAIDDTSGLKIYNNKIEDFSVWNRMWNRNFLFKYVITKNNINLNDSIEFWKLTKMLNNIFWIKLTKKIEWLPIYNNFLNHWINNNKFKLSKDVWNNILNSFNELILSNNKKGEIKRLYIILNQLIYENNLDIKKWIIILEKDILNKMNLKNDSYNKNKLRKNLLLLSNLNLEVVKKINWEEFIHYKRLFEFWINNSKNKLNSFYIKSNINVRKIIWLKKEVLENIKDNSLFNMVIDIDSWISNFNSFSINKDLLKEKTWITKNRPYKRFISKLKELYSFRETEKTIYLKNI